MYREAPSNAHVTLTYGDGGAATQRFIKNEIIERFSNPVLNQLEDGSSLILDTNYVVMTTDSYIVEPLIFPGGDIGKLAVAGTVNDLVASGARPLYMTLSLIIGEGLSFAILRRILDSIKEVADSANVKIIGGDTKVFPSTEPLGIFINTTGIGAQIQPGINYAVSQAREGDNIVITGSVGNHGFAVLSAREGLGFGQKVESDCAPLSKLMLPILEQFNGIQCLRDPTRGGIAGALIDIAEASKVDLHVDENLIPIAREVAFGCEMMGIDPLLLVNEGIMVMILAPEQTKEVLSALYLDEMSRESVVIGTVQKTQTQEGRVIFKNGPHSRLAVRLEGDPLPRLC